MIVLVSNGQSYSDHRLYFIEAESVEQVREFLATTKQLWDSDELIAPKARVVGSSKSIDWLAEGDWRFCTTTFEAFSVNAVNDGYI